MTPGARISRRLAPPIERGCAMNGWLMWGLILPVLLVVAGVVTIRRRNHRS